MEVQVLIMKIPGRGWIVVCKLHSRHVIKSIVQCEKKLNKYNEMLRVGNESTEGERASEKLIIRVRNRFSNLKIISEPFELFAKSF